jgi:DNA replication protein DnaD
VVWAVDEALAGGKKFYAYVRGILSRRVARGAKSMDDIRQMEERRHNGTDQCFGREGPGDAPGRFDCDITV